MFFYVLPCRPKKNSLRPFRCTRYSLWRRSFSTKIFAVDAFVDCFRLTFFHPSCSFSVRYKTKTWDGADFLCAGFFCRFFFFLLVGIDFVFDVDNSSAYTEITTPNTSPFMAIYHVFFFCSVLMFGTLHEIS